MAHSKRVLAFGSLAFAIGLLQPSKSLAQNIRVLKAKGNQAVVEFVGGAPTVGKTYSLGGRGPASVGGGRDNSVGGSFSYESMSTEGHTRSATQLSALYGWVFSGGVLEAGPLVSVTAESRDNVGWRTYGMGAFGDFNLVPNVTGNDLVYGATGILKYSSKSVDGTSGSETRMIVEGGGLVKYFFPGTTFCFRGTATLAYDKVTTSTASGSETGFRLTAGIQAYF